MKIYNLDIEKKGLGSNIKIKGVCLRTKFLQRVYFDHEIKYLNSFRPVFSSVLTMHQKNKKTNFSVHVGALEDVTSFLGFCLTLLVTFLIFVS